jgi:hypothetical protein
VDDCREGAALAGAPHTHDFFEEIHKRGFKSRLRRVCAGVNLVAGKPA